MLLTISTTHQPATELGFLLHKHPSRVQCFDLKFGKAHVFYPEVSHDRCTAALLLEIDPIQLVRGRKATGKESSGPLDRYVNDRPYVASSFLSVALARVFGTAMAGTSDARPELTKTEIPLEARLEVVAARGGERLLHRLFEPLGYSLEVERHVLDDEHPEWGASPYYSVKLGKTTTLRELLTQLYVLVPVLDDDKHYYIGEDEIDKLLRKGQGWLDSHPAREEVALRYLKRKKSFARQALQRLDEAAGTNEAADEQHSAGEQREAALEKPMRLNETRLERVHQALSELGASKVVDLGCGEGKLVRRLLRDKQFERVVGMDTAIRSLEVASERLRLDEMAPRMRKRVDLLHGSLIYRDKRLTGYDAATLIEVIEHIDPSRLESVERVVFACARPKSVVVTTPNIEFNARFERLENGAFRHPDHRFEWTRSEFRDWAEGVASRHGYECTIEGIGEEDPEHGHPCQMAVFRSS